MVTHFLKLYLGEGDIIVVCVILIQQFGTLKIPLPAYFDKFLWTFLFKFWNGPKTILYTSLDSNRFHIIVVELNYSALV